MAGLCWVVVFKSIVVLINNIPIHSETDSGYAVKHSYLGYPRLHFSGNFFVDPMTTNNKLDNFNMTRNFGPRLQPINEGYNPQGTGNFMFSEVYVTSVCFISGRCTDRGDSIIGQGLEDWYAAAPAKLIDILTLCDTMSTIYGMELTLSNVFRGRLVPTTTQQAWIKRPHSAALFAGSVGIQVKSILTDIKWFNTSLKSQFLAELNRSNSLSIKFNLDMYDPDKHGKHFLYGRVVGTIGMHHVEDSIPSMRFTRFLRAKHDECLGLMFCHVPFAVDDDLKILTLDMGNSIRINGTGNFDKAEIGRIFVSISPGEKAMIGSNCESYVNSSDVLEVRYDDLQWYLTLGGVVSLNISDTFKKNIANAQLVMFQTLTRKGKLTCKVILTESQNGITVGPMHNNSYRRSPYETLLFTAFVSQFGKPVKGLKLGLQFGNESTCRFQLCGPCSVPFSKPRSALEISPPVTTDTTGTATIMIKTNDLKYKGIYNRRTMLQDAQVYLLYTYATDKTGLCIFATSFLAITIYKYYKIPDVPTWHEDVRPIFEYYTKFYPVMNHFVYLLDYDSVLRNKEKIKRTLDLPTHDPHYMPTTRDLSPSKRDMIKKWLNNPVLGNVVTISELKRLLQQALLLEFTTIPPYLTALMSIKEGTNVYIAETIRSVLVQEMLHLVLVANILNAIGGTPLIASPRAVPIYPTRLPGGVRPDLEINLQGLSKEYVESVFMEIERPEQILATKCAEHMTSQSNFVYGYKSRNYPNREHGLRKTCFKRNNTNTITVFYKRIKTLIIDLAKDNDIFIGNRTKQINSSFWYGQENTTTPFSVDNLTQAINAINMITEQGEGSNACLPLTSDKHLSHFFKFSQIVQGKEIRVKGSCGNVDDYQKFSSSCDKNIYQHCKEETLECNTFYDYTGESIPFNPHGVWPITHNPTIEKLIPFSRGYRLANAFSRMFTGLLHCVQEGLNGQPSKIPDCIGLMHALNVHGKVLAQTPIDDKGDPDIGPNIGPVFQFIDYQNVK